MKLDKERLYLLTKKQELEEQLKNLNFKGYPEVKTIGKHKYIYLRHKSYDKNTSKYACAYNEDYYLSLKALAKDVKALKTEIRIIRNKLARYGYTKDNLSNKTIRCIDYVRANLKYIIYGQCVVEGVSATFLDTETILDENESKNVNFTDTLKIKNLKNAWQYILDEDTIKRNDFFSNICDIAGFVNDRLISYGDQLRSVDINITGTKYKPAIPNKDNCIKNFNKIINSKSTNLDKAIDIFCYITKNQLFLDGNKRTALIAANLFLIKCGEGYLAIPQEKDKELKNHLINYYESKNETIKLFFKTFCFYKLK